MSEEESAAVVDAMVNAELPDYFISIDAAYGADSTVVCEYRDGKFFRIVPREEWELP